MNPVQIYGADWCGDTRHTCQYLDSIGVVYEYHDIDTDPAALDWVKQQNKGKRKLPTLDVGGEILSIPQDAELERTLQKKGVIS